jgi:transposase
LKATNPEAKHEIIHLFNEGESQTAIAKKSGVNQSTVSRIIAAAKNAGLIITQPEAKKIRRMSDQQFNALFADPRNTATAVFRKEASRHPGRSRDTEDAIQQAWEKIITMQDGQERSYYLQAGIWAMRDYYKKQVRQSGRIA